MRAQAERLEWTDLDAERKKVTLKASKNGTSRTIKISKKLINLLFSLPKKENTVFQKLTPKARQMAFRYRIKNLARLHQNPRFLKINLHTFRHCKALREYHRTRDILHVKMVLGHRDISTTMRYVELYKQIYSNDTPRQYITKIGIYQRRRYNII